MLSKGELPQFVLFLYIPLPYLFSDLYLHSHFNCAVFIYLPALPSIPTARNTHLQEHIIAWRFLWVLELEYLLHYVHCSEHHCSTARSAQAQIVEHLTLVVVLGAALCVRPPLAGEFFPAREAADGNNHKKAEFSPFYLCSSHVPVFIGLLRLPCSQHLPRKRYSTPYAARDTGKIPEQEGHCCNERKRRGGKKHVRRRAG